jgi:cell migration-inducing and hyaluronan-binding protein
MGKKNRSFLLVSAVPAFLLASAIAVLGAQESRAQSVTATNWSDPATWPNRKVPAAGDKVTIGKDKQVVLDVSPPALGGLSIDGKLSFSDSADLELTTEWIMLHGELAIGSEARPHTRKATITLTDNVKGEDVMAGMGDRGIMLSGGTLNLHGSTTNTWSKLAATANAGATSIQVLNAKGWKVGDEIVLASTDFNPRQAERRTIAAIRGNTLTLDKPLDYMHFGRITFDVDERGEVGLLTRNIKIQASADAEQSFFGGHIMAMPSSRMYVSGVELNRMGQNLTLARYPIHWHLVGDAKGQYIKNAAIHDTYNRCVTVHGTNDLRVENNVTYNTVGHCFFLEDGIEHGNQFVKNLAIQGVCPDQPRRKRRAPPECPGCPQTEWPEVQGRADPLRQHGDGFLDHQSGQQLHRQRGRGFRCDRLLVFPADTPARPVPGLGHSQDHLAAPNAAARIQGQRGPFQLRRVHD